MPSLMTKRTRNNILGMAVYFLIAMLFGSGYALLALMIHEDNDRCHYYQGSWNRGDLIRGILSISIGALVRYLML